jgi:glycoside/pentoside/hexuronide:cation symporter, GPH family
MRWPHSAALLNEHTTARSRPRRRRSNGYEPSIAGSGVGAHFVIDRKLRRRSEPVISTARDFVPGISAFSYAAPMAGSYFFYIAMWSILPGVYGKYFGLKLTAIATVVLVIRLFDGIIDTTIGYLSDLHRAAGGSRKPWVVVGGLGSIAACYFLFVPPNPTTTIYYLTWSMAYFLAFTIAEIPHLSWGSELTMGYQERARVFGIRNMIGRAGMVIFYALPLMPFSTSRNYTPGILHEAVYVGGAMTLLGLAQALFAAPAGSALIIHQKDSVRLFVRSISDNRPLLLYVTAFCCIGVSVGMWSGLLYFFVDGYLGIGNKLAIMLMVSSVIGAISTPLCLKLIHRTSKSTTWAVGITVFLLQLIGMLFIRPGASWWAVFGLVVLAHIFFCCHDIAALSLLGDIVDYAKLKFRKDRGATYFGLNTLIFKIGLGIGGGVGIGVAGLFGFDPSTTSHSATSVLGLRLGFLALPACFALLGLLAIRKTPINRRRHGIIRKRLKALANRSNPEPSTAGLLASSHLETEAGDAH